MKDRFEKIIEIVHRYMQSPSTSWGIGSYGAIAEFHMEPEETVERSLESSGGTILSGRGAIRIDLPGTVQPATIRDTSARQASLAPRCELLCPGEHGRHGGPG